MLLFWDTETTGLPAWNDPSDAPHQPHVIELAMIITDFAGVEVDRFDSIVKPGPGAVMAKEAFEAHGISLEQAMDEGVDPKEATEVFLAFVDRVQLRVGHNESFDRRMMRIMAARHLGFKWDTDQPSFCTLYKSKFIINLPPTPKMIAAGMPGPKSPNLGECVQHFFNEPLEGAHRAMTDVQGSKRVFFHLTGQLNVPMFKKARAA